MADSRLAAMPEPYDISNDFSGFTARLMKFAEDARHMGIPLRITITFDDPLKAVELASYLSSPTPPSRKNPPEVRDDGKS